VLSQYDNLETRAWLSLALQELGVDPTEGAWLFRVVEESALPGLWSIVATFTPRKAVELVWGDQRLAWAAGAELRLFQSHRYTTGLVRSWIASCGLTVREQSVSEVGDEGVFWCGRGPGADSTGWPRR